MHSLNTDKNRDAMNVPVGVEGEGQSHRPRLYVLVEHRVVCQRRGV